MEDFDELVETVNNTNKRNPKEDHSVQSEPPIRLCCGQKHFGSICPDNMVMCCLCFERFKIEDLNVNEDGKTEDCCKACGEREREMIRMMMNDKLDHANGER